MHIESLRSLCAVQKFDALDITNDDLDPTELRGTLSPCYEPVTSLSPVQICSPRGRRSSTLRHSPPSARLARHDPVYRNLTH